VFSGAIKARAYLLTGSLSQWTDSGDIGLNGGIVHAPAAVALKPVRADVTVPGSGMFY